MSENIENKTEEKFIIVGKITPEQRNSMSDEMYDLQRKHKPGIRKEIEYVPRLGGRGYYTKDYERKIKG